MENTPHKIRELKRRDRKVLAAMIKKLVDKIGDKSVLNLMVTDSTATAGDKPESQKDVFSRIGIELVKMMIEVIESDVAVWFADLLGVTAEQFDDMPFDIELIVIEQLMEAEESNRFFTIASRLSSRTRALADKFQAQKTK